MIRRILIGALGAAVIAIVVLALMLRSARLDKQALIIEAEVAKARIDQASRDADAAMASLDRSEAQREVLQAEFDQLDALLRSQPSRYANRPIPRNAAELRQSILRATRK